MSYYLNRYFKAVTSTNWKDGDYEEIVYCYDCADGNLKVLTKSGKDMSLPISAMKQVLPNPTPKIDFPVGYNVEYVYDYHWKDGEYTSFGKIMSIRVFYNDVTYDIHSIKDNSVKSYPAYNVKQIANLKNPRYAIGHHISIITVPAQNQFVDDIRENGVITAVNPEFTKVTYVVKLDSGATMCVEEYSIGKAIPQPKGVYPQQIPEDDEKYLKLEEERLMQQLQAIRARMNK